MQKRKKFFTPSAYAYIYVLVSTQLARKYWFCAKYKNEIGCSRNKRCHFLEIWGCKIASLSSERMFKTSWMQNCSVKLVIGLDQMRNIGPFLHWSPNLVWLWGATYVACLSQEKPSRAYPSPGLQHLISGLS